MTFILRAFLLAFSIFVAKNKGLNFGAGELTIRGVKNIFVTYMNLAGSRFFPAGLMGGGRKHFCTRHKNVTFPTPQLVINDSSPALNLNLIDRAGMSR